MGDCLVRAREIFMVVQMNLIKCGLAGEKTRGKQNRSRGGGKTKINQESLLRLGLD